jgi:hypothetical protein
MQRTARINSMIDAKMAKYQVSLVVDVFGKKLRMKCVLLCCGKGTVQPSRPQVASTFSASTRA